MSPVARPPLRTLLVEDEEPARDRLRRLLAAEDGIEIVGQAEDGTEAVERVLALAPDLVFLDIEMPGASGLEVVASLPAPRPQVIFCTAYDRYAVDAFELAAVDYLLKPVSRARLAQAVARAREARDAAASEAALERAGRAAGGWPRRFLARRGTRYAVVGREEVLCFVSERGLTALDTAGQRLWMQPPLGELEQRLDPEEFFRVSRAAIVRLGAVHEVRPEAGGQGTVILANGQEIEVSRRRFKDLLERLDRG